MKLKDVKGQIDNYFDNVSAEEIIERFEKHQLDCEEISEKAIELGYTKEDFDIEKKLGDGWVVIPKKDIDLTKIREYIKTK